MPHSFHIPVMGTCFTADTPIRIAHLGIGSAISLVDDRLLERIGIFYAKKHEIPYEKVNARTTHARAERIRRFLDLTSALVAAKMEKTQAAAFTGRSDKDRYFKLLPTDDPLRVRYLRMMAMSEGAERAAEATALTQAMRAGDIDVNIMVKLDRPGFDDAKDALLGYAKSSLKGNSGIIFSAGINQALFSELAEFPEFYRNAQGGFDKKIILKISDYRSALVQGKFLARKGLEVSEYRVESGLNCGGHLFPAQGELLPAILGEVSANKEFLCTQFDKTIRRYYESHGLDTARLDIPHRPFFSVQGGVGNYGESRRLIERYGMDRCGWGSPFLLVPEATLVDDDTRKLLAQATEKEIFMSHASPIGVPFNNLHTCGAEIARLRKIREGNPGVPCIKGFLQNDTEFSEKPICTASREYQKKKIEQIKSLDIPQAEMDRRISRVLEKTCICHELGNSGLIALGLEHAENAPQSICPGPNIAYFDHLYTLDELVDYIYGRGKPLVPENRPHLFALEIRLYAKWFREELAEAEGNAERLGFLNIAKENLERGMDLALSVARSAAYPGENLESIEEAYSLRSSLN